MTEQVKPPNCVTIVGCGDIGRRVARLYLEQHIPVIGIVKSDASFAQARAIGIQAQMLDLDADTVGCHIADNTVFYFAPPPSIGVTDTRMQQFISQIDRENLPIRVIYISTTGVYGNCAGDIVTEATPANPSVDRAHRRYDAEQQLRAASRQHGFELVILRVGGIYGPKRLPLERIKKQVPMIKPELSPATNRIHEDDLARVCVAAAQRGKPGEVYNVSDGTASNMTEYFLTLADHFGLPRPPLVDWDEAEQTISAGMLSYLKESRRISNQKMRDELKVELLYPNLQAGLDAMPNK